MLASPQYYTVDRVLVQLQKTCCGSYTNSLGRMVDDLSNGLGRQMETKKGAGLGGREALATGAAV